MPASIPDKIERGFQYTLRVLVKVFHHYFGKRKRICVDRVVVAGIQNIVAHFETANTRQRERDGNRRTRSKVFQESETEWEVSQQHLLIAYGRQTVAEQFPELLSILPPRRRPWQSEDYRMTIFDAAAVGIAYFAENTPQLGNTSRQSQNKTACEMMSSLFDADFDRSRLAICEWTIKQRRESWIQEKSWQN